MTNTFSDDILVYRNINRTEMYKMKTEPYKRKAYYYETDRMDIVHHSNYVRWFEEARVDLLNKIDCPFENIEKQGLMSPVLSVETHYKYPVKFADEFEVRCSLTEFNGCTYSLEYEVFNLTSGKIACTGKSQHCFTDSNLRPVRLKKKYPEIYDKFMSVLEKE